jgi:hypothetical protein
MAADSTAPGVPWQSILFATARAHDLVRCSSARGDAAGKGWTHEIRIRLLLGVPSICADHRVGILTDQQVQRPIRPPQTFGI